MQFGRVSLKFEGELALEAGLKAKYELLLYVSIFYCFRLLFEAGLKAKYELLYVSLLLSLACCVRRRYRSENVRFPASAKEGKLNWTHPISPPFKRPK